MSVNQGAQNAHVTSQDLDVSYIDSDDESNVPPVAPTVSGTSTPNKVVDYGPPLQTLLSLISINTLENEGHIQSYSYYINHFEYKYAYLKLCVCT